MVLALKHRRYCSDARLTSTPNKHIKIFNRTVNSFFTGRHLMMAAEGGQLIKDA